MNDHETTREVHVRQGVWEQLEAGLTSIPAVPDPEDREAVAELDVDQQERDALASTRKAGLMLGFSEEEVDRIIRETVAEDRQARKDKERQNP